MSQEDKSSAAAPQTATVLIATGDSATRDLLRRILHVGAVEVVDAADGVEALALARRLDLDLILLDAFLAVMDGISVCARIRALVDIDQPPIVIVGLSSERAVEVALASGADETLAKPLNPVMLRSRTRELLRRRHEEKTLRLMQRAIESAPVGVTILDARSSEYTVLHANRAFGRLTGYETEEMRGRNLRLLKGPETDVAAMTELRDAMAAGRRSRVVLKNYRKDGTTFWNELSSAPILDASGRLTHYVAIQHDVTSLLEAPEHRSDRAIEDAVAARTHELDLTLARVEDRRRFTETILNAIVSGILVTDARGRVTFANLAALRTLGTSLADCVGRPVVEIFAHNEGVAEIISGHAVAHVEHRLDFPFISPGGARFYVGMSITQAPEELRDEVGFIFLFRNLAETIEDESDPRLRQLAADAAAGAAARPERASPLAAGDAAEATAFEDELPDESAGRRVVLALRYCSALDLVRRALDLLASEQGGQVPPVRIEPGDALPELLVDRQQVAEALAQLTASAIHRCGDATRVLVRLSPTEAVGDKGVHPGPSVRIEILYPRALITEMDLRPEAEAAGRPPYRHADLATAERLLEANGGRLIRPLREAEEQALTVILRAAK
jgi:PAS domain S-box-containing protein